jgi:hypothetical protein
VTVLVRTPRLTVPVLGGPVAGAPATGEAPARLVDALALAADIRAAGAVAFRVHEPAVRG